MSFSKTTKGLFVFAAIIASTTLLFQTAFIETWKAWQTEEYSHGYLVPLIGVLLLLHKSMEVRVSKYNSWLGLVAAIFCIVCLLLFELSGIRGIQPLLLIAFIWSIFLCFYGVRYTWAMAAPLGFLVFLAPLPKFLYYKLSFNMQLISTDLSVLMLHGVNISVFQEGNVIDLGLIKLEVAEACNGLRYLFPLMALGYLVAFIYKAPLWKRIFIFLSTIPITIMLNSIRIFIIGVSANIWGGDVASGIVHDAEGWIVFIGCLFVLFAEVIVLQKFGRDGQMNYEYLMLPPKQSLGLFTHVNFNLPTKSLVILITIVALLFSYSKAIGWGEIKPVPLEKPLSEFPMQVGEWVGTRDIMDKASLDVLGTEDYLLADYRTLEGESVNLYILYYPKQDSTSNQAVHSPEVCIPGGGWEITSHDVLEIKNHSVNRLIIDRGQQRQLVYYWFYQGNDVSVSAASTRLSIIKHTLFEGKSNGGMIRVITNINKDESINEADKRLQYFISASEYMVSQWVY